MNIMTPNAEISIKYLCSSISNLMEAVKEVKSAKDLTDQEIECILPEAVEKWKTDLEDLKASKVELVKELVGLNLEKSGTEQLDASNETVVAEVKQKLSDPKAA